MSNELLLLLLLLLLIYKALSYTRLQATPKKVTVCVELHFDTHKHWHRVRYALLPTR